MLKKFTPIIQDEPILFNEDIYLFTDSGAVLTGRQGGESIKNIFSLIDKNEYKFVRDNMFFAYLQPLLLVDSNIGPIFIDNMLFASYRLLVAIVPHFGRSEILSLAKSKLKPIVLASPRMKEELEGTFDIMLDESHDNFVQRLLNTHRGDYYYRVHGRTNGELAMLMSEIAYDYSCFCGCELDLNFYGVGVFEMKNSLCLNSYIFALISLLFTARNYSMSGRARMDIYFDQWGISFEFGFELADEYKSSLCMIETDEVKNFKNWSYSRFFQCDFFQDARAFAVRGKPWFVRPDSADLKEKRREFIYNI